MKKVMIVVTAALLLTTGSSFASTREEVNQKALTAFSKDFSTATSINWQEWENFYLVEFKVGDTRFNAAYNEEGDLIASSRTVSLDELPAAVTQAVNKKYAGYELGNNAAAITVEGRTDYYLTIANSRQVLQIRVNAAGHIKVEHKRKV